MAASQKMLVSKIVRIVVSHCLPKNYTMGSVVSTVPPITITIINSRKTVTTRDDLIVSSSSSRGGGTSRRPWPSPRGGKGFSSSLSIVLEVSSVIRIMIWLWAAEFILQNRKWQNEVVKINLVKQKENNEHNGNRITYIKSKVSCNIGSLVAFPQHQRPNVIEMKDRQRTEKVNNWRSWCESKWIIDVVIIWSYEKNYWKKLSYGSVCSPVCVCKS